MSQQSDSLSDLGAGYQSDDFEDSISSDNEGQPAVAENPSTEEQSAPEPTGGEDSFKFAPAVETIDEKLLADTDFDGIWLEHNGKLVADTLGDRLPIWNFEFQQDTECLKQAITGLQLICQYQRHLLEIKSDNKGVQVQDVDVVRLELREETDKRVAREKELEKQHETWEQLQVTIAEQRKLLEEATNEILALKNVQTDTGMDDVRQPDTADSYDDDNFESDAESQTEPHSTSEASYGAAIETPSTVVAVAATPSVTRSAFLHLQLWPEDSPLAPPPAPVNDGEEQEQEQVKVQEQDQQIYHNEMEDNFNPSLAPGEKGNPVWDEHTGALVERLDTLVGVIHSSLWLSAVGSLYPDQQVSERRKLLLQRLKTNVLEMDTMQKKLRDSEAQAQAARLVAEHVLAQHQQGAEGAEGDICDFNAAAFQCLLEVLGQRGDHEFPPTLQAQMEILQGKKSQLEADCKRYKMQRDVFGYALALMTGNVQVAGNGVELLSRVVENLGPLRSGQFILGLLQRYVAEGPRQLHDCLAEVLKPYAKRGKGMVDAATVITNDLETGLIAVAVSPIADELFVQASEEGEADGVEVACQAEMSSPTEPADPVRLRYAQDPLAECAALSASLTLQSSTRRAVEELVMAAEMMKVVHPPKPLSISHRRRQILSEGGKTPSAGDKDKEKDRNRNRTPLVHEVGASEGESVAEKRSPWRFALRSVEEVTDVVHRRGASPKTLRPCVKLFPVMLRLTELESEVSNDFFAEFVFRSDVDSDVGMLKTWWRQAMTASQDLVIMDVDTRFKQSISMNPLAFSGHWSTARLGRMFMEEFARPENRCFLAAGAVLRNGNSVDWINLLSQDSKRGIPKTETFVEGISWFEHALTSWADVRKVLGDASEIPGTEVAADMLCLSLRCSGAVNRRLIFALHCAHVPLVRDLVTSDASRNAGWTKLLGKISLAPHTKICMMSLSPFQDAYTRNLNLLRACLSPQATRSDSTVLLQKLSQLKARILSAPTLPFTASPMVTPSEWFSTRAQIAAECEELSRVLSILPTGDYAATAAATPGGQEAAQAGVQKDEEEIEHVSTADVSRRWLLYGQEMMSLWDSYRTKAMRGSQIHSRSLVAGTEEGLLKLWRHALETVKTEEFMYEDYDRETLVSELMKTRADVLTMHLRQWMVSQRIETLVTRLFAHQVASPPLLVPPRSTAKKRSPGRTPLQSRRED
jgi:hypothetical protein